MSNSGVSDPTSTWKGLAHRLRPGLRQGFSLVEMIAVMAVGSALLVLAASLVHRSMRLDTDWREYADTRRALNRLAQDFREDVHVASQAQTTQEPVGLQLIVDGDEVNYTVDEGEIIRVRTTSSGEPHREFYKLPSKCHVEIETLSSPSRVRLTVKQDLDLKGVPPRLVFNVEAQTGRLQRLIAVSEATP